MIETDTIVAPATPMRRSALAVVRIDGPGSTAILEKLTGARALDARQATLTRLWQGGVPSSHPRGDELIDECIALRFAAPHSFTGNDLVEITLHGNPVIVQRLIAACVTLGARLAEPGEFTERAVLNGKLDLVQAESIADLINARTVLQTKLSLSNLEGHLSRTAGAVRRQLLDVVARTEAGLDFSEEGYEFIDGGEREEILERVDRQLESLAETFRRGRATAAGLSAAIVGLPNAGKSTLLNRLVGSERAIVTPIPGTTRDVLRETIEIGGLPVTLADTAGLRESDDVVEGIGIERAREELKRADLVLYLVDSSRGLTEEDRREIDAIGELGGDRVTRIVYTKTDLGRAPADSFGISVTHEVGIDELLRQLDELVRDRFVAPEGALVNERQRLAVEECREAIRDARESEAAGVEDQFVLVDLYRAGNALGLLTGAITRDEILAEIFGRFCLGK